MFHEGFPDFADNTKIALPAWGFYVRHAEGVRFESCTLSLANPDGRKPIVTDDAEGFSFAGGSTGGESLRVPLVPAPKRFVERLGTCANRPGYGDFRRRMEIYRKRLLARGVNCAPLE